MMRSASVHKISLEMVGSILRNHVQSPLYQTNVYQVCETLQQIHIT